MSTLDGRWHRQPQSRAVVDAKNMFQVVRWEGQAVHSGPDELVLEAPLEIRVRRQALSVTMRTPGHDAELAVGFLVAEDIVRSAGDVVTIESCPHDDEGNTLNVVVAPHVQFDKNRLTRHVFANASCGLCGKATIEAMHERFPPVDSPQTFAAGILAALPETMLAAQETFHRTGGLHAAAIFDASGRMLVLREDVGRHNAVDKVVGHCLLKGIVPLNRHILLVSGRVSFEIIQKALAAQVPLVAAISAPSSLAVEFALESGQTLIGFLGSCRMNVYAHPQRVKFPGAGTRKETKAAPKVRYSIAPDEAKGNPPASTRIAHGTLSQDAG